MNPTPPKIFIRFLQWFCKDSLQESILGDLEEQFYEDLDNYSDSKAKRRFVWNILRFFRPGIIRNFEGQTQLNNYGMLKNYLKMALRNANRDRALTILNVFCLAVGLTACLYVAIYAKEEFSYDQFHKNGDRIYRINQTFIWGDVDELFGSTGPAVMNAVWSEVPEFEMMVRVHPLENAPLVYALEDSKKTIFEENLIRAVDSTFFDVFTFPLIKGNPKTALVQPSSIVITEEMALKYFHSTDVLGKQMVIQDEEVNSTFQVTGVAKDMPPNSHITFDMLISMNSIKKLNWSHDSWIWTTFVTFGVLRKDADPNFVGQKVAEVPGKYLETFLTKYRGISYKEFLESGETWDLYIQPLLDIHLYSQHVFSRLNERGDIKTILVMSTIAGLILLLSIINFVNLTTAKSSKRSKEVGVRKVMGSSRSNLIWQFMIESVLFCFTALILSIGLLQLFIPIFNSVSGKEIGFEILLDPILLLIAIGVTILIGMLAGLYPAFYLSSFQPVKVLKGQVLLGTRGNMIRNTLVTFQFTVSIALISSSLIVKDQVRFWLEMDLGFNRQNIIVVQNAERLDQSLVAFKQNILSIPSITHAAISTDTPPYIWDGDDNFQIKGVDEKRKLSFWSADEDFAEIYDLKFIAGRNYMDAGDHATNVVVTRSLAEAFGFNEIQNILGETLSKEGLDAKVIGVIEDFETEIDWEQLPMAIYHKDFFSYHKDHFSYRKNREVSIRYSDSLKPEEISHLLMNIEQKWDEINPGMPMKYYFVDQEFQSIFEPRVKFGRMIDLYSVLAIIIAGLGLIGLVAFIIERRTKEIGIRKVLGASITSVMYLLTKEFGKLLLIGFIFASGISWYFMSEWVKDFQDQASISWVVFALAGLTMLLVSLLTIGYQTLQTAKANPVDSLRNE